MFISSFSFFCKKYDLELHDLEFVPDNSAIRCILYSFMILLNINIYTYKFKEMKVIFKMKNGTLTSDIRLIMLHVHDTFNLAMLNVIDTNRDTSTVCNLEINPGCVVSCKEH